MQTSFFFESFAKFAELSREQNELYKEQRRRERDYVSICITASRIMKAKEVKEHCKRLKDNDALRIVLELEIKQRYIESKVSRKSVAI